MPSANRFSPGRDVWVIAGNHSNRQSAEHAAKVVRCHLPSSHGGSSDEIMVEWHSTGTAEVVSIDRVRPMYEDDGRDAAGTSCAETSSQQPTRKSRRASKKPDRFDNCFASSKYQSMSVHDLRKKCKVMGIDSKGCAKGDMIALIVKREEKERWKKDDGKSERSKKTTDASVTSDDLQEPAPPKAKSEKKVKSKKAAKVSTEAGKHSPKKKSTTPRKVHLSQRVCAIFSPSGRFNGQTKTKSRRISEIRRRRNDMEERVRTKLLTARKKRREEDIENENNIDHYEDNSSKNEINGDESCKRLFHDASTDCNSNSSDDASSNGSDEIEATASPATICYPMPSSPSPSSPIPLNDSEDAVQIHIHNADAIQTLYGRLHLAKADYINNLQAIQKMKADGGYDAEDIAEIVMWKDESKANVDMLRSLLKKAMEERVVA